MLYAILHELQTAPGPVTLQQLSRKLGIQPGALDGMIQFWERKGRLVIDDGLGGAAEINVCGGKTCLRSCPGPAQCPLVTAPLKSYTAHHPPTARDNA